MANSGVNSAVASTFNRIRCDAATATPSSPSTQTVIGCRASDEMRELPPDRFVRQEQARHDRQEVAPQPGDVRQQFLRTDQEDGVQQQEAREVHRRPRPRFGSGEFQPLGHRRVRLRPTRQQHNRSDHLGRDPKHMEACPEQDAEVEPRIAKADIAEVQIELAADTLEIGVGRQLDLRESGNARPDEPSRSR